MQLIMTDHESGVIMVRTRELNRQRGGRSRQPAACRMATRSTNVFLTDESPKQLNLQLQVKICARGGRSARGDSPSWPAGAVLTLSPAAHADSDLSSFDCFSLHVKTVECSVCMKNQSRNELRHPTTRSCAILSRAVAAAGCGGRRVARCIKRGVAEGAE